MWGVEVQLRAFFSEDITVIKCKRIIWDGLVALMGNVGRVFGFWSERMRPRGGGDVIRMDVRKIWWEGLDWIHLDQDKDQWRVVVGTVMNLRVP
jgi:hypothetical protein